LDQEVGDALRIFAPRAQQVGQAGKFAGGLFGYLFGGLGDAQGVWLVEDGMEYPLALGGQQIVQGDLVYALDHVGEVGVDQDAFDI
jgi:hypothetical protein